MSFGYAMTDRETAACVLLAVDGSWSFVGVKGHDVIFERWGEQASFWTPFMHGGRCRVVEHQVAPAGGGANVAVPVLVPDTAGDMQVDLTAACDKGAWFAVARVIPADRGGSEASWSTEEDGRELNYGYTMLDDTLAAAPLRDVDGSWQLSGVEATDLYFEKGGDSLRQPTPFPNGVPVRVRRHSLWLENAAQAVVVTMMLPDERGDRWLELDAGKGDGAWFALGRVTKPDRARDFF